MSRIYKFLNISLISLFIFLFFTLLLASLLIIKSIPDYNRVVTNSLVNEDVEVYEEKFKELQEIYTTNYVDPSAVPGQPGEGGDATGMPPMPPQDANPDEGPKIEEID